jgi:hypothetical protein
MKQCKTFFRLLVSIILIACLSLCISASAFAEENSDWRNWTDIKKVVVSYDALYGLRNDGTVLCYNKYDTDNNECIRSWKNVSDLFVTNIDYNEVPVGLTYDGEVLFTEDTIESLNIDLSDWKDVRSIVVLTRSASAIAALHYDGSISSITYLNDSDSYGTFTENMDGVDNICLYSYEADFACALNAASEIVVASPNQYISSRSFQNASFLTEFEKLNRGLWNSKFGWKYNSSGASGESKIIQTVWPVTTWCGDFIVARTDNGETKFISVLDDLDNWKLTAEEIESWSNIRKFLYIGGEFSDIAAILDDGTVKCANFEILNQTWTGWEDAAMQDVSQLNNIRDVFRDFEYSDKFVFLKSDGTLADTVIKGAALDLSYEYPYKELREEFDSDDYCEVVFHYETSHPSDRIKEIFCFFDEDLNHCLYAITENGNIEEVNCTVNIAPSSK